MEKHQPFVIPAGVKFEISDRGVNVEHVGDIIINGSLGKNLDKILSHEGSITLRGKFEANRIEAPMGVVRLDGTVEAGAVRGAIVELGGRRFKAKSVRASRQIIVGGLKITADILMAPRIDVDPKASGLVTILESHNETGPNAIKGGFTVSEYNQIIGNAASYLAERGVEMLDRPESSTEEEVEEDDDDESISQSVIEAQAEEEAEVIQTGAGYESEESTDDPDTSPDAHTIRLGAALNSASDPLVVEEIVPAYAQQDDELANDSQVEEIETIDAIEELEVVDSVEPIDDLPPEEPQPEQTAPVEPQLDPVYDRLKETLAELVSNYAGVAEPPALSDLGRLIEDRDYDAIRQNLPRIWNDLVKYHRETGLRIRRQVTATFNNIMGIVKNSSGPGARI